MDRLISEQAVIESIEFFQMNPQHFDFVNLIDDIKEIPSAEPKTGHWIPVSERLPETGDYVLCSIADNYSKHKIIISQYNREDFWSNGIIEAWMPLPKPYKAESEE